MMLCTHRVGESRTLQKCKVYDIIIDKYITVFSPAYIWHVGPISLQYGLSFDVGMIENPKALKWQ